MQAVKGYFADGHFTPTDDITLPRQASAILVIAEEVTKPTPDNFWHEFDKLVDASMHEKMPDFHRLQLGREPIMFTED